MFTPVQCVRLGDLLICWGRLSDPEALVSEKGTITETLVKHGELHCCQPSLLCSRQRRCIAIVSELFT